MWLVREGEEEEEGISETSVADKKTSLRSSVRAHAENTPAHSNHPALSVRTRPEGKRETVSWIISVLSNAVPNVFTQRTVTNFL